MTRKVYRSLDRSASVFGVKGRYLVVMAFGAALSLVVGIAAGTALGMIAGAGVTLLGLLAAYIATLTVQSRIDERNLLKVIVKRSLPELYRVPTRHPRNIWTGFGLPGRSSS